MGLKSQFLKKAFFNLQYTVFFCALWNNLWRKLMNSGRKPDPSGSFLRLFCDVTVFILVIDRAVPAPRLAVFSYSTLNGIRPFRHG